jgi:hypothetical protein
VCGLISKYLSSLLTVISKYVSLLAVAAVMLIIGALAGYGLGGRVVTVTTTIPSPTTITFYTPYPTTVTTTKTETFYTLVTITTTITYTPTPVEQIIEATLRQVVSVGPWRLAVLDVKEAKYIKTLVFGTWSYYKAPEGMKIVIITMRIENTGTDVKYPFGIGEFTIPVLVTDVNKSYDRAYIYQLEHVYEVTKEIEESAVEYRELDIFAKVAPGAYIDGDFIYLISATEKPLKIATTYWPSPFEPKITIVIRLS